MYQFKEQNCRYCKGTGDLGSVDKFKCSDCRGTGIIKRDIIPLEDYFSRGWLRGASEQFECPDCEQEWHLADTCESESGDYDKDLYKCDCGAIVELYGEWHSNYHISINTYKE